MVICVSTTLGKKSKKPVKQKNPTQKTPQRSKKGRGFADAEHLATSHLGCQTIYLAVSWKPAPAQLLLYKLSCRCCSAEQLFCCSEKQPLLA